MAKVLFSHSYFYRLDAKQWKQAEPFPPLMTITAAAHLRQNGFDVALFDVALKASEEGLDKLLEEHKPDYFVIFDDGFNWLTKMCLSTMREAAFRMQRIAKSRGIKVITCSSDSTDHVKKYLDQEADVVIRGEGERTLLELINAFEEESDISGVKGISFKKDDEIVATPKRPALVNLDELPQPAWDLIEVDKYKTIWKNNGKPPYLNIATTRGCPYKCNWCAKPIYGTRYNSRSPQRVVDEIEYHAIHNQVNHFWMCDDIFGLKPGWVQQFRDELQNRQLKVRFKIQSRADLLLKEDNIQALVDSGLDEVWIGAESGSQKILDAMDKGTSVAQIHESTNLLKKHGVKVGFFIQYGYLGETLQDINLTIKMIKELLPDLLGISVSYPLPGTKFYDLVKSDLQQKANWVDSDDLDMMFKNTYQPAFYKVLHKYTHNIYKIEKGFRAARQFLVRPHQQTRVKIREIIRAGYHIPLAIIKTIQLRWLA
ncbi:MAG: radical SAM protein [Reichenbachiella sp.]|uniref:B12-binding domain-containing radical SAM protein n=1 Tax=Reichenbachiella sp. TaxID=2184521 RepID=UPI0032669814